MEGERKTGNVLDVAHLVQPLIRQENVEYQVITDNALGYSKNLKESTYKEVHVF